MYRRELPAGHGMFFVFPGETEGAFWMKNTYLPLDILFIDSEGIVVEAVENTTPLSEELIPSPVPYRCTLELPAGTVQRHGIKKGDRVYWPDGAFVDVSGVWAPGTCAGGGVAAAGGVELTGIA